MFNISVRLNEGTSDLIFKAVAIAASLIMWSRLTVCLRLWLQRHFSSPSLLISPPVYALLHLRTLQHLLPQLAFAIFLLPLLTNHAQPGPLIGSCWPPEARQCFPPESGGRGPLSFSVAIKQLLNGHLTILDNKYLPFVSVPVNCFLDCFSSTVLWNSEPSHYTFIFWKCFCDFTVHKKILLNCRKMYQSIKTLKRKPIHLRCFLVFWKRNTMSFMT